MSTTNNSIVKRTQIRHYMDLGTADKPKYTRMGDGWTKFDDSSSAQTESTKYINMDTQQEDTTSYKVAYAFECDLMYSDPTIKEIYRIYKDRKVLSECEKKVLTVDMFDGNETDGYNAYLETLAVAPSGITENNNKMKMSGNFNGKSDPIHGKFIPDGNGGTFTPSTAVDTETAGETT